MFCLHKTIEIYLILISFVWIDYFNYYLVKKLL